VSFIQLIHCNVEIMVLDLKPRSLQAEDVMSKVDKNQSSYKKHY